MKAEIFVNIDDLLSSKVNWDLKKPVKNFHTAHSHINIKSSIFKTKTRIFQRLSIWKKSVGIKAPVWNWFDGPLSSVDCKGWHYSQTNESSGQRSERRNGGWCPLQLLGQNAGSPTQGGARVNDRQSQLILVLPSSFSLQNSTRATLKLKRNPKQEEPPAGLEARKNAAKWGPVGSRLRLVGQIPIHPNRAASTTGRNSVAKWTVRWKRIGRGCLQTVISAKQWVNLLFHHFCVISSDPRNWYFDKVMVRKGRRLAEEGSPHLSLLQLLPPHPHSKSMEQ